MNWRPESRTLRYRFLTVDEHLTRIDEDLDTNDGQHELILKDINSRLDKIETRVNQFILAAVTAAFAIPGSVLITLLAFGLDFGG